MLGLGWVLGSFPISDHVLSTTGSSPEQDQLASPRPCMLHQRVSRSSFLTVSRLAAKRALPQGSRIIWDSRLEFPARPSPRARLSKQRSLGLSSRFPSRSSDSIVHGP